MSVIVRNLTKIYGTQRAVDQVSFEARPGEIIGFLGPNGAGKSTTMKIATGYLPPTQGTVEVCGYDVRTHSKEVRKNIGYLPEHNPLYLDMYVKEYLGFIARLHKVHRRKINTSIAQIIERCGLQREQHKKIGALSKGYRQRVGLAQAMIHDPKVLVLDEPTTGLDPNQILEIREVIRQASQDKTIVFSTHILQEVQALCHRAVIIHLGKIVADSPVAQLKSLATSGSIVTVEFAHPLPESKPFHEITGVSRVEPLNEKSFQIFTEGTIDIRPDIFKLAAEKGWVLLGLHQQETTLEDVFAQLTKL